MKLGIILLIAIFVTSCATMFADGSDTLKITSNPAGAIVLLNGKKVGVTPLDLEMDRDTFAKHDLILKKKGYKSEKMRVQKTIEGIAILNLSSIPSWATDAVSGNMLKYSPTGYYVELKKKNKKKKKKVSDATKFILINKDNIQNDLFQNGGEYTSSYAKLKNMDHKVLVSRLKMHINELATILDNYDWYQKSEEILSI